MTSTSCSRFARALSSALALLALLATASAGAADDAPVVTGPFQIVPQVKTIGAGRFPNVTGNPFGRMPVTVFTVKHRGRAVVAADGGERIDQFWDALVLESAPRPTVIAAVDGVYLFTEDAGRLRVETLAASRGDIATLQWLDAKGGQPDAPRLVTIRARTGESRTLAGGTLLLLNGQVVLDVAALRTYPVRFDDVDGKLGGYAGSNEPVKSLSPGRTQLVVVGSRPRDDRFEYALLAAEYATGRIRAVPFDRTFTRFESVWDATPDWVAHYFQWTRQADRAERLEPRTGAVPRPWQGRFARSGPEVVDYRLRPVRPAMRDHFVAFLERQYGVKPVLGAGDRDHATVNIEGWPLKVWHKPAERTVSLYAEASRTGSTAPAYALIERIGAAFNAVLARGEHQADFASFEGDN